MKKDNKKIEPTMRILYDSDKSPVQDIIETTIKLLSIVIVLGLFIFYCCDNVKYPCSTKQITVYNGNTTEVYQGNILYRNNRSIIKTSDGETIICGEDAIIKSK